MATTSRSNRSLFQSLGEAEQGNGSPEVNPFKVYNPFDILIVEGLVDDPVCSNNSLDPPTRGLCTRKAVTSRLFVVHRLAGAAKPE